MSKIEIGTAKDGTPALIDLSVLREGRLLIQGLSRTGKTWLLRRLLEQAWGEVQQVIVDMEGEYPSLADVFGHLVLDADEINRVGPRNLGFKVREHRFSVVLDLSDAERSEQARMATEFLRGLVDVPEEHWSTALVAVDEAHLLAPHGASSGTPEDLRKAAVAALTDLMARGSKRGLIGVVATQRLAKIAKSVVSEASNILIGRNNLDLDVARAADLLGLRRKNADAVLRRLRPGTFVGLGPAIAERHVIVQVGDVESDHKGRTPDLDRPPVMAADDALDIVAAMPTEVRPAASAGGRAGGWSDEDIEILAEGWESGRPRREIAAELGRSVGACYQKAANLGFGGKRVERDDAWTDEEIAVVRQGYDEGITRAEILARLPDPGKRSVSSIGYIAGELGLFKAAKVWTDDEIETLRRMAEDGASPKDVCEALGRPRGGVNSMATKQGIYFGKPWKSGDYALLQKRHAEGVRMVDIAAELDRPYVNVAKIAERMGLRFNGKDQPGRQAKSNQPVRVSEAQLVEMARTWHDVIVKPKGGFILDQRHSYSTEQLVARVNRHRASAGEGPVSVKGSA